MKSKKFTAILLSMALTVTWMTGCGTNTKTPSVPSADAGGTEESSQNSQSEEAANSPSEDAFNAPSEEADRTIGLLVPATVGDPFIALSIKGLDRLAEEQGATLRTVETLDSAEYEDQVRAMADMGANPVYLMWGDLSEIALRLAPEYPDTNFVLCDVDMQTSEPNVSSVSVDPSEAAFIAGVVAANNTTEKKVGFIAHADRPVSRKYRDGYINGVHYIDPSIEVAVAYVGDDQDPVKGQEVAKLMIQNEGVDLIFQSASQSGLGVISGCEEMGIKCIGSDDYQGDVSDCVIWSALKPIDEALYMEGDASFKGTFKSGDKVYGLSYGLALYTDTEFNNLSADLQNTVTQVVNGINSGEIDVTADTTE